MDDILVLEIDETSYLMNIESIVCIEYVKNYIEKDQMSFPSFRGDLFTNLGFRIKKKA